MSDDLDRQEAAWLRGRLDAELGGLGARPEALQRILARAGAGTGSEPAPGAVPPARDPRRQPAGGGRRRLPPWLVAAAAVAAVAAAVPVVRAARDGLDTAGPTSSGPAPSATASSASPFPTRTGRGPVPPATGAAPTSSRAGSVTATGSPGTTASTSTAGPGRCDVPTLVVSVTGPDGAAGTIYHTLVLTNAGEQACYLEGFPGVAATDGTTTVDAKRDTRVPATKVVLQPGGAAHAVLAVRNVPSSTAPCPAYNHLRVTAPDSRRTTSIPLQVRPCDGVMTVGVVQPGAG